MNEQQRRKNRKKSTKHNEVIRSFSEGFGYTPKTIKIPPKEEWDLKK